MAVADRLPRRRTGDPALDQRLLDLLAGRVDDAEDRDLLFEMLATVLRMADDDVDRLNLKITNAALREMRQAFRVFAPFRHVPKVTIFGSARTLPEDPLYIQTRKVAAALAGAGWMVVTGAGPGIMAAGAEGAGRDHAIGVNIRLPFEQEANPFIASDPKLVTMKYFFTRKLMLMKESAGFVVLPGGFGTLDETFELLTLLQTGKAAPAPLVLLDVEGGTYWQAWDRFIRDEVAARGLVDHDDLLLCRITTDADEAVAEVLGFFRNYHSMRYVGSRLVLRLKAAPTPEELGRLNEEFADICVRGQIEATGPLPAERADNDRLDLPRLVFVFDRMNHGRLRALIDALNTLPSAPPLDLVPDETATQAAGSPPEMDEAPPAIALDPAVADLLAGAGSQDERHATDAVTALQRLLEAGGLDDQQQHAVVSALCQRVLDAPNPPLRVALVQAIRAASPFVGLDEVLQLLLEHQSLGDDATAVLLGALDAMLERAAGTPGDGQLANLLRIQDPRPTLAALGTTGSPAVAEAARAAHRRVDNMTQN